MEEVQKKDEQIGKVYLHVCNSGVTLTVTQTKWGAEVEVNSNTYGNINNVLKIVTDNEGIKKLSDLFLEATKFNFETDKDYAVAYPLKD